MPLNPGTVINNRYRIAKLLGEGGFGAVYRAWDMNFEMPCALKENYDTSPDAQRQFLREAQILHTLRHPNLPLVKDHFIIPGQGQYLVMDYIQGQDLQELLGQAGGPLPESQVLPWIIQICDALTYMHNQPQPVIHRDIKPANIKINPQGQAILVDFGIAKVFDPHRKTTMGARAVTPGYSPFEQYGSAPTDARTDIYALGATAYALLTGQEPTESIARMAGSELTPPRLLNPSISENTESMLLKALETMPARRYQTAGEFKAALTQPGNQPTLAFSPHETIFPQPEPSIGRPPSQPPVSPARTPSQPPGSGARPPSQPPSYQPAQLYEQPAQISPAVQVIPPREIRQSARPIPWKLIAGIGGGVVFLLCIIAAAIILPRVLKPTPTVVAYGGSAEAATNTPRPYSTGTSAETQLIATGTVVETAIPSDTPTPLISLTATYPPEARTLNICLGSEPATLYLYDGSNYSNASEKIMQAVYDGPIDNRNYAYQPVILQKLPSLADGDATVEVVSVQGGEMVVDDTGNVVALSTGIRYRPTGCRSSDCAINYSGGFVQMDRLVVTYTLLPGLTWSDGTPLTAADSVYSFSLAADPDTPNNKYLTDRTLSYIAVGDLATQWTGIPGFMDPTYFTNFWTPLPQHVWSVYTATSLVTAQVSSRQPVGWGPYIIDDWISGDHISMRRNPNYFRRSEGLPVFSNLVFHFTGADPNTNIAALLSGDCDIVDSTVFGNDQTSNLLDLSQRGQINAVFSPNSTWEHVDFNIQPVNSVLNTGLFAGWDYDRNGLGPFADARLRLAITMCLDREAVVNTVFSGQTEVAYTLLSSSHPLFNPDISHWGFDPTSAGQLLDEIGWLDTDGNPSTPRLARGIEGVLDNTPLSFSYETTNLALRQQVTQILANSLAQCGIQVTLNYYPASEWFANGPDGKLFGRRFDLGEFAWVSSTSYACGFYITSQIPSPDNNWSGQNDTGYSNSEFDYYCNLATGTLPGETGYEEYWRLVQQMFSDELPVVPLFFRNKIAATNPDICNFMMDATSNELWNIEAFGYASVCP